ncbi:MAG: polyphosphate kinase 2 family protein [Spirosomataceae bacterium]
MKLHLDLDVFEKTGNKKFSIAKAHTKVDDLYQDKDEYDSLLAEFRQEMDELQSMMYAHNRYGLLIVFQAMDAAGKDGTIKHVLSGVNPAGVKVQSFKRPSDTELNHDFLWRTTQHLPERGSMTIFNRSYYEEVLVVKVHPEILTNVQRLPAELTQNVDKVWKQRYEDIVNMEHYLHRNGIRILKFFLHVSKKEQGQRLIERIEDPTKNWKFEEADIKERERWDDYQQAYEDCINATATELAPWYVIPADDKKNMRLIISQIIVKKLKELDMSFPETDAKRHAELQRLIGIIKKQDSA